MSNETTPAPLDLLAPTGSTKLDNANLRQYIRDLDTSMRNMAEARIDALENRLNNGDVAGNVKKAVQSVLVPYVERVEVLEAELTRLKYADSFAAFKRGE